MRNAWLSNIRADGLKWTYFETRCEMIWYRYIPNPKNENWKTTSIVNWEIKTYRFLGSFCKQQSTNCNEMNIKYLQRNLVWIKQFTSLNNIENFLFSTLSRRPWRVTPKLSPTPESDAPHVLERRESFKFWRFTSFSCSLASKTYK